MSVALATLALGGVAWAAALGDRADGSIGNELAVLLVVTTYVVGATVLVLARPDNRIGILMLLGGTAWGIGEGMLALGVHGYAVAPGSVPGYAWLGVLGTAFRGLGWLVLIVVVPLVFPDGRLAWPGRRWPLMLLAVALASFMAGIVLAPEPLDSRLQGMSSPTGVSEPAVAVDALALTGLAMIGALLAVAVAGLVSRWRSAADAERRQLQWFAAAFACPLLIVPVVATPWAEPWMFALVTLPVPVVVAVTGLQRRIRDGQERLVRAREDERRRLRRDLHDGLGPALAALTLRVDTLRNRAGEPGLVLDEELLGLRSGIQDTLIDLRRIVEGLRPPALDELGVSGAIEQLAVGLIRHDGLAVDVRTIELPAVPAAVEVALYRVAQEALTNVVKHAGATRARVELSVRADEVRLEVVDNGAGGAHARNGGVGLISMRERAEEIGGSLRVTTQPGGGTTVALVLPLEVQP